MHPNPPDPLADDEDESDATVPLTAEQAADWRKRHPALSPWRVVAVQALAGLVATLVAAGLPSGPAALVASTGYGALCVLLPAALFAHGLTRAMRRAGPGARAAPATWMKWEMAKLAASLAMLLLAPLLVPGLSWLALLAGMVVTMKAVWLVLWMQPRRPKTN